MNKNLINRNIMQKHNWSDTGSTPSSTDTPVTASNNPTAAVMPAIGTPPQTFTWALGVLGLLGGLWYANKKGSKFWGYVGWGLFFNTLGCVTGVLVDTAIEQYKKK